ncbi:hypothetical protein KC992_03585 [Candidatus Saccharibacteria bacterium]|nr:hypothetical protein [Candidatus Saccharibacteria bacterium]
MSENFRDLSPDNPYQDLLGDDYIDYQMGNINADGLFDPLDFEVPEYDFSFRTDNEYLDMLNRRQCQSMSSYERSALCKDIQEKRAQGLDYSDDMDKIVSGNIRFIGWFVRETMGFHKQKDLKSGKKPTRSKILPGVYLRDFAGMPLDFADRFQEATLGFMNAVLAHDAEKGDLMTIALWYMEGGIIKATNDASHDYGVRIPTHAQKIMRRVVSLQKAHENAGTIPNLDDSTQELETDRVSIEAAAVNIYRHQAISLERILEAYQRDGFSDGCDEDVVGPAETVYDPESQDAFDDVEQAVMVFAALDKALGDLSDRKERVINLRFGLDDGVARTLEAIGKCITNLTSGQAETIGITRERVRTLEAEALAELRHNDVWFKIGVNKPYRYGYFLEHEAPVFGGLPQYIRLSEAMTVDFGLEGHIIFDRSPGVRKNPPTGQPKFVYQEDWSDD